MKAAYAELKASLPARGAWIEIIMEVAKGNEEKGRSPRGERG